MSFQKVTLLGRVTKQGVSSRFLENGVQVANLTISTADTVAKTAPDGKDRPCPAGWVASKNGKSWEVRTFWRITGWGKMADYMNQYIEPGNTVFVEGEMNGLKAEGFCSPRIWEDKEGVSHADFEVTAKVIQVPRDSAPEDKPESGEEEVPF
jgi:single stranded DNA-binding protein